MVTPLPAARLRIVFFGTPAFAVPTLDALLRSAHSVVGVVTQPDRPRGRGHKVSDTPVKALAQSAGVPIFQPHTLKDPAALEPIAALHADLGVVAAYGKILPASVLSIPRHGLLNVHASLLPKYRGAAPVHRAVIAGERETGVTIMRVVQALDAGPMLARVARAIGPEETSDEVERDLARIGGKLLVDTLNELAAGTVREVAQDDGLATYAHKLTKDDGVVDWSWSAERIHDLIRGLHPWPHAFTFLDGRRLILLSSRWSSRPADAQPGAIVRAADDTLEVATGAGILDLHELQPEGKRSMTPREFLAGHRRLEGHRFGPR